MRHHSHTPRNMIYAKTMDVRGKVRNNSLLVLASFVSLLVTNLLYLVQIPNARSSRQPPLIQGGKGELAAQSQRTGRKKQGKMVHLPVVCVQPAE